MGEDQEMNTATVFIFLIVLVAVAEGHTYLSSVTIGGVNQGERKCLRGLYSDSGKGIYPNSPINDVKLLTSGLTSANMTCGFLPYAAAPYSPPCAVAAGSKMGLTWRHEGLGSSDFIIEDSHKGPCLVYMAKGGTSGNVWFKVYEEGYVNGQWCSLRIKQTGGYMEFTIPATLPAGDYVVRGEVIALHDGDKLNGAQPYVSCADVTITGGGSTLPTNDYLVPIPGVYKNDDAGIRFNTYTSYSSYPIPGPKLYVGTAQPSQQPTSQQQQPTSQQQSSQQTPSSQPQPSTGGCTDIVAQCKAVCGTRDINTCSCVNGSPTIVCGSPPVATSTTAASSAGGSGSSSAEEASAASSLKPFFWM